MGAWLERDIGGGAARRLAGLGKRDRLGMRAAADGRPAAADDDRLAAVRRATISAPTAGLGQVWPRLRRPRRSAAAISRRSSSGSIMRGADGGFHRIRSRPSSTGGSPASSPTNASKSLASRKLR